MRLIFLFLSLVCSAFGAGFSESLAFKGQGSGTPAHQADTLAWKADVIANGGAAPGEPTLNAMDTFVISVAGIKSQLIWIDLIVPDNLIAAQTPLYHTSGIDPSTGLGWSGALDVNGIHAGNAVLSTGINTATVFSTLDMGLWVYCANTAGQAQITFGGGDGSSCAELYGTSNPNYFVASYSAWSINMSSITVNTGDYVFFGGSRTTTSLVTAYSANGNNAWASRGTSAGASGAVPNSGTAGNSIGWMSGGVCAALSINTIYVSFMGVTHGMVSADGQTLYSAVQVFRTTIGGGKT